MKEPAVIMVAEQQDDLIEDALGDIIPPPEKPYKGRVVANLAKAVSAVAGLMDLEYEPPDFGGSVERLDGELVRLLAMVAQAAEDYGSPLPLGPEEVRGDNELIVISDHLSKLSKDRDFRDFLEEEVDDGEDELDMLGDEEEEKDEIDEDALFRSRL